MPLKVGTIATFRGFLSDKSLYEKMKLIDELEEKDRTIIHGVIDAFLVNQQMWNVLNKQVNPA